MNKGCLFFRANVWHNIGVEKLCEGELKMKTDLKLVEKVFENKQIRTVWNSEEEKYYISVIDMIGVLTDNEY